MPASSPFHVDQLPNGLVLLGQYMPEVQSAAVCFAANTGARDEEPSLKGISHFLEHMVFKGTARRSGEEINREFEEMGAENNAFTSWESTVYYGKVLHERIPACIDLLADMMRPRLDAQDFATERNVILEEIARYEDIPARRLIWHMIEQYYGEHPLATNVIGTPATLKAMVVEQMRDYWQQRYAANNLIFSIAGNFSWDDVRAQVAGLCSAWPQGEAGRVLTPAAVRSQVAVLLDEKVQQQYIYLLLPGVSREDPDRYVADVLATVLGDESGSRLFWNVLEAGLAEAVGAGLQPFLGSGLLIGHVVTSPDKAPAALAAVRAEFRKLQESGVQEDELEQAKIKLATAHVLEGESSNSRMLSLVDDWVAHGRLETLHERVAAINAVTIHDCRRLLERFSLTETQVIGSLGPLTEEQLLVAG
jgi:predicted Zn-dependent peptidase